MNILLIGSGGREHALAWKIKQSNKLGKLFIAPGNAGTSTCGINLPVDPDNFNSIKTTVLEHNIDMLVVGPEEPLVNGIHDFFLNDSQLSHVTVIGPLKAGAMLEGSKDFAKHFMKKYNIPTAIFDSFKKGRLNDALKFLHSLTPPYVLKADGLAAGKGVIILDTIEEAMHELEKIFNGKFGNAGNTVVIEQYLKGIELSVFIITDGKSYKILPEAKDYKRVGVGDTGMNTGGMGAVSPVPFANEIFMKKVEDKIIKPTLKGLESEGISYSGFLFFGLISVNEEPYVIEYNVRLGDPETEVILPRVSSDIIDLFEGIKNKNLIEKSFSTDPNTFVTVMLVSGGYPGKYEKNKPVNNLELTRDSHIFHSGTREEQNRLFTNGGRVLSITSSGSTMQKALEKAYSNAESIDFEGKYYRKDIGYDLKIFL